MKLFVKWSWMILLGLVVIVPVTMLGTFGHWLKNVMDEIELKYIAWSRTLINLPKPIRTRGD